MNRSLLLSVLFIGVAFRAFANGVVARDGTTTENPDTSSYLPYRFNVADMTELEKGSLPRSETIAAWKSALLDISKEGSLVYQADADGFVLPDFSHAGYMNGNSPIPEVPVIKIIAPIKGDNTGHIQNAIDEVGSMPLNEQGIRGALLLEAGLYEVRGPIRINHEGMVLRGEGNGSDPAINTVIYDHYRDKDGAGAWRSVLQLGNNEADNWDKDKSDEEDILDELVPVGAKSVRINKNTSYKPGDLICIYHPCTSAWLAAVDYGDVGDNAKRVKPWGTETAPIYYHRSVTKVSHTDKETLVEFDAPVFYSLRRALSQSVLYRFKRVALQNIGLENLRVDCAATVMPDERHSWNSIGFVNADNCWARDVVAVHFSQAGFYTQRATAITFERCHALDPVAMASGGRMYNFNQSEFSQLILYKDCYARGGRHNFVSNGTSTVSGCVVYRCKSEGSRTTSEGHRIWSQGMLFDSYEDFNPISSKEWMSTLGFYNRWNMGSGHGWAMAHGVMWNCNLRTDHRSEAAVKNSPNHTRSGIYCEKPPTAQNYVIGCWVEDSGDVRAYKKSLGYVEGINRAGLFPSSLYEAQLKDRADYVGTEGRN
jgi:hypothetical protein